MTLEQIETEIAEVRHELAEVKGTETEIYTRIVGYYRSLRNWNKGKKEEYGQRVAFEPDVSTPPTERKTPPAAAESPVAQASVSSYSYFFRKSCPNCPPVAELINRLPLSGAAVDVDSEEGQAEALAVGVMSTPTVVFYDQNGQSVFQGRNVGTIKDFFSRQYNF
jgi:hypothetical protein